jgi:hypothetical protein
MKLWLTLCVRKIQSLRALENFAGHKGDMSNRNGPSILSQMCRHVWFEEVQVKKGVSQISSQLPQVKTT